MYVTDVNVKNGVMKCFDWRRKKKVEESRLWKAEDCTRIVKFLLTGINQLQPHKLTVRPLHRPQQSFDHDVPVGGAGCLSLSFLSATQ